MKKLLSFLATVGLVGGASLSVTACEGLFGYLEEDNIDLSIPEDDG